MAWEILTDFAERRGLNKVQLDLNVPWLHEAYNAIWKSGERHDYHSSWRLRTPIVADQRIIGHLEFFGSHYASVHDDLPETFDLIQSLEPYLVDLHEELSSVETYKKPDASSASDPDVVLVNSETL